MIKKWVENYCYEGLGFPVELKRVEVVEIDHAWHPIIDVQKVASTVINALAYQKTRFTGNQVKFIRSYFSMPLRQFGLEVVHESHAAVDKWEKNGNKITSMNNNTEYVLRLFIVEQLKSKTQTQQHDFFKKYQRIKVFFNSNKQTPMDILHIGELT